MSLVTADKVKPAARGPESSPASRSREQTAGEQGPLALLRRGFGNRAAGRFIQAKLKISRPGDEFEREADRAADEVMRMAAPAVSTPPPPRLRRTDLIVFASDF